MKTIELTEEEYQWLKTQLSKSEDTYSSVFWQTSLYKEDCQRDLRLCKSILEKL